MDRNFWLEPRRRQILIVVVAAVAAAILLLDIITSMDDWSVFDVGSIFYLAELVAIVVAIVVITIFLPPLKPGRADPETEARRQLVMSVMAGEARVDRLLERANRGDTEFEGPPEVEEVLCLGPPFPMGYVTLEDCYYVVAKARVADESLIRVRSKGRDVGVTLPWKPGIGMGTVDVTGVVHLPEEIDPGDLKADVVKDALFVRVPRAASR